MGSALGPPRFLTWHPVVLELHAPIGGKLHIWRQPAWRRGYIKACRIHWDLALTPTAGDEFVRRRRAFAGDEGLARFRDIVCQICCAIPCAC